MLFYCKLNQSVPLFYLIDLSRSSMLIFTNFANPFEAAQPKSDRDYDPLLMQTGILKLLVFRETSLAANVLSTEKHVIRLIQFVWVPESLKQLRVFK